MTYDSLRHVLTPSFYFPRKYLLEIYLRQLHDNMRRHQLTRDQNKQNVLGYLHALVNHKL